MNRRRKLAMAALLATALFILSITPVYAQESPVPPEDLTPVTAWITLTTLFLPLANALVKRFMATMSKEAQSTVIFIVCVVVGLGQAYFNGSLKWANGDPQAIASLMVVNVAIVVVLAYGWYKMLWQATGVDARISGISGTK